MLARLKHYAERYYGNGFNMVNKIKEDIAGVDRRSWGTRDQLKTMCVESFCNGINLND